MLKSTAICFTCLIFLAILLQQAWGEPDPRLNDLNVHWQKWSPESFTQAKNEHKLVLLDLEAVWCHWCHVMDAKTYHDPRVVKLINQKFIAVKVDQDSRPDLSSKYEEYGWPATVLLQPSGKEIEIRSGFLPPNPMIELLTAAVQHPDKIFSSRTELPAKFNSDFALDTTVRQQLEKRHQNSYDTAHGGWGFEQKFLDAGVAEYALERARGGDKLEENRLRQTLTLMNRLIDPVWGGVYQYSTDDRWDRPHFEKIMLMQAEDLRVFALAYELFDDQSYLKSAKDIERYLRTFLTSPEGAFYTSQDADLIPGVHSAGYFSKSDQERRGLGLPRIDKHIYSRENGWAINALCQLYMATGDKQFLNEGIRAANWIIANRAIEGGGFKHEEKNSAGPYLGDTESMGRACLNLYTATGDRRWLSISCHAADFVDKRFKNGPSSAGYSTTAQGVAGETTSTLIDENVMLAIFTNLLHHYTGNQSYQRMSKEAMRFVSTPAVALSRHTLVGGLLLSNQELGEEPMHATIVGSKADSKAQGLFEAAVKFPSGYKRIEWFDRTEGALPNPDVDYPPLPDAAAFLCVGGRCSSPVSKPESVLSLLKSTILGGARSE